MARTVAPIGTLNWNADFKSCHVCKLHPKLLQATLAAANVASVLQKYPVASSPDVLAWVDGEFNAIPKAAPSIVNAKDLSLEVQSDGGSAY